MKTLIRRATLINEGRRFQASVVVSGGIIERIEPSADINLPGAEVVEAEGAFLLPGAIDDHVHMRQPGLTHKATMESETRAAAAGGVTSVMDMPNTLPPTVTNDLWQEKMQLGASHCLVNYAFHLGATHDNLEEILRLDPSRTPAVKLFMGSSTGNMLVDDDDALHRIFSRCPTLLMTHCEDSQRIAQRMAELQAAEGDDPDVRFHPDIRDAEACHRSSEQAVRLARETGARLHVAHITTERELRLFSPSQPRITAEACVAHLLFARPDYATLGTRIKANPAVKEPSDRQALRQALSDGRITLIATDHAPHLLSEKQGGCLRAASGMPMVQFALPAMLTLADQGVLSHEQVVELMCHAPARLFGVVGRGFLREGYRADLVLLRHQPFTVRPQLVQSLCRWSPLEGQTLRWRVERTWVNGNLAWDSRRADPHVRGEALLFEGNRRED